MKEKVSVFTLGCKTNLYESRQLVAGLKNAGYRACEGLEKADIYIINTCAVTNEAERKSRQAISRCKKLNPDAKILVCGCAAQHDGGQFSENVNFVAGTADKLRLIEQLNSTSCRRSTERGKYLPRIAKRAILSRFRTAATISVPTVLFLIFAAGAAAAQSET